MNNVPSKAIVQRMRERYPEGTRIALVHMGPDPYSKLEQGDRGTVRAVDDMGTIHVNWDCGSRLGLAWGVDSCRRLTQEELDEEQKLNDEPELEESGPEMSM